MSVKGLLATLLGLDASGIPYALAVDEDGNIEVSFPGQIGSGSKRNPKGKLISPVGISPTGVLKNIQVAEDGSIIITLVGGNANEIVKSDGTDAEWDTLADVIEAVILTADGDILIRSGGVAQRLAKGSDTEVLTLASGVPAWVAPGAGGYDAGARVYNSGNLTIGTGGWADLTFDSERYDTDAIHSTVSDTGRLTCKTAGVYVITLNVEWTGMAAASSIRIQEGGDTLIARVHATFATGGHLQSVATIYKLGVNDYVTAGVYHESGGNEDIVARANVSPEFAMSMVGVG